MPMNDWLTLLGYLAMILLPSLPSGYWLKKSIKNYEKRQAK